MHTQQIWRVLVALEHATRNGSISVNLADVKNLDRNVNDTSTKSPPKAANASRTAQLSSPLLPKVTPGAKHSGKDNGIMPHVQAKFCKKPPRIAMRSKHAPSRLFVSAWPTQKQKIHVPTVLQTQH